MVETGDNILRAERKILVGNYLLRVRDDDWKMTYEVRGKEFQKLICSFGLIQDEKVSLDYQLSLGNEMMVRKLTDEFNEFELLATVVAARPYCPILIRTVENGRMKKGTRFSFYEGRTDEIKSVPEEELGNFFTDNSMQVVKTGDDNVWVRSTLPEKQVFIGCRASNEGRSSSFYSQFWKIDIGVNHVELNDDNFRDLLDLTDGLEIETFKPGLAIELVQQIGRVSNRIFSLN